MKKLDNSREKFMSVNVDNLNFQMVRNSEYVDKSDLITLTNNIINIEKRFICVTRPRRLERVLLLKC